MEFYTSSRPIVCHYYTGDIIIFVIIDNNCHGCTSFFNVTHFFYKRTFSSICYKKWYSMFMFFWPLIPIALFMCRIKFQNFRIYWFASCRIFLVEKKPSHHLMTIRNQSKICKTFFETSYYIWKIFVNCKFKF